MPDYKTMYFALAGKVADAVDILTEAMRQGEDSFLQDDENVISLSDISKESR